MHGLTRVALVYDLDACRDPTGVTRHALAQLERLARRPEIALTLLVGRMSVAEGLAYWETLGDLTRRELPISLRNILRWWRFQPRPAVEWWTGALDWVYSPAEFYVPTKRARRAVTSHDVMQDLAYGGVRRRARLELAFRDADLVLSVSKFNTERLIEAFPHLRDRVAIVPNAADDLFFEPATERERSAVRAYLGLPPGMPYLLSVANFQSRKNLSRLIRAAGRLREAAAGELAIVLLGSGAAAEADALRVEASSLGPRAVVRLPGYRQGRSLRAAYAEASGLVFASLCESFGIPTVEAMAQSCPVLLANSTALPEVAGAAGWYFDPTREESITSALREMLDDGGERARRVSAGVARASEYRWERSNERLAAAFAR